MVSVSATATGPSLVPVTVMVSVELDGGAMLVLDRVADDDVDALADGEPVEVGAGVELDLVGDDAGAALAGGSEAAVTVSTAPLSTSVSLARTSTVRTAFSAVVSVSATATGPSLVPVTVMVRVELTKRHARPRSSS